VEFSAGGRPLPASGIPQAIEHFRRPVARLVQPVLAGERVGEESSTDGHPTSLDLAYDNDPYRVVVRTIRQMPPGTEYGRFMISPEHSRITRPMPKW